MKRYFIVFRKIKILSIAWLKYTVETYIQTDLIDTYVVVKETLHLYDNYN